MAETVVNRLKIVEIDTQNCCLHSVGVMRKLLKGDGEHLTIEQGRKRIVTGKIDDPLARPMKVSNVSANAAIANEASTLVEYRLTGEIPPT
ncbi:hypothetical protein Apmu_0169_02 [Acidiphilium multivorum AIU301]|nr:hypothetical protein Apmu_0169_02 [Acidiphilium multivorum AIU301]